MMRAILLCKFFFADTYFKQNKKWSRLQEEESEPPYSLFYNNMAFRHPCVSKCNNNYSLIKHLILFFNINILLGSIYEIFSFFVEKF